MKIKNNLGLCWQFLTHGLRMPGLKLVGTPPERATVFRKDTGHLFSTLYQNNLQSH